MFLPYYTFIKYTFVVSCFLCYFYLWKQLFLSDKVFMPVYFNSSNISADHMLYSEKDLEKSMDKIETIHFHEEKDVGGVKFWCYNAGHVLGAAMFMIEIAGVKVPSLYSLHIFKNKDFCLRDCSCRHTPLLFLKLH